MLAAIPLVALIEELPSSVLGAVVIVAVMKLIDVRRLWRIATESPAQSIVAVGTLVATLLSSPRVERGVLIGVALAIGVHLYRELTVTASSEARGTTLHVRPRGVLWFATVPQVERLVRRELATQTELDAVVIDLAGVGRLDYTGAAALGRLLAELRQASRRRGCPVPAGRS